MKVRTVKQLTYISEEGEAFSVKYLRCVLTKLKKLFSLALFED